MRRTNGDLALMKQFEGIQEVGEDFSDRIDEIHGMYDKSVTALERIPGKLLSTTGLADGPVWGIFQLRFRDRIQMLTHAGPSLQASLENFTLPGQYFDLPSYPIPEEVPIGEPPWASDWPIKSSGIQADIAGWTQGNETAQQNVSVPQSETGTVVVHDGNGYLTVDPTSLDFVSDGGSSWTYAQDLDLVTHLEGFWLQGFCLVKVTWDKDYFIVMDGSFPVTNGEIVTTRWQNDYREAFSVAIDHNALPAGDEVGEVVFTAVDGYINPKTLLDSSGNGIVASLAVNLEANATLSVSAPASVDRGVDFSLEISSSYAGYVPSGNLDITDDGVYYHITPTSVDNTDWKDGKKTIVCQFNGERGAVSVQVTVTDPSLGVSAQTPVDVQPNYPNYILSWTGPAWGALTSPQLLTGDWYTWSVTSGVNTLIFGPVPAGPHWSLWFWDNTGPALPTADAWYKQATPDMSVDGAVGGYTRAFGTDYGTVTISIAP